jgi:hypothetical protein
MRPRVSGSRAARAEASSQSQTSVKRGDTPHSAYTIHAMPCQTTVSTTPVDTVQCCRPFPLEQTNLCPSLWRQSTDIQTRASAPSPSPSSSQEPDDRILDAPPSPIIRPDPIVIDALMICRADSVVAGPGSRLRRRPSNNVARVASLSPSSSYLCLSLPPRLTSSSHRMRIASQHAVDLSEPWGPLRPLPS